MQVGDLTGFGVHFRDDRVGFEARRVTPLLKFENVPVEFVGTPLAYKNGFIHVQSHCAPRGASRP